MKVVVIGTSNSVIGLKGYLRALRLDHEIVNLSSGRTPFYKHIKTILMQRSLIEDADVVIVDHFINDANFYNRRLGQDYARRLDAFYRLLATLNTRVINLVFPIKDFDADPKAVFYRDRLRELSETHGLTFLDLNRFALGPQRFRDNIHISVPTSYVMGLVLSKALAVADPGEKPSGGAVRSCPFRAVAAAELCPGAKAGHYANSLLSVDFVTLTGKARIEAEADTRLVSLGYLREPGRAGASGITINGRKIGLPGLGYFHDALRAEPSGPLRLSPAEAADEPHKNIMGRGTEDGPFGYLHLCDFLFLDGHVPFDANPAARPPFNVDISGFGDAMEVIVPPETLPAAAVDALRDAAIAREGRDLKGALELMEIALGHRPKGQGMIRKVAEYRRALAAAGGDRAG